MAPFCIAIIAIYHILLAVLQLFGGLFRTDALSRLRITKSLHMLELVGRLGVLDFFVLVRSHFYSLLLLYKS